MKKGESLKSYQALTGRLPRSQIIIAITEITDFPVTVGVLLKSQVHRIRMRELAAGDSIAISIVLSTILNRAVGHLAVVGYRAITTVIVLSLRPEFFLRSLDSNRGAKIIAGLVVVL